MGRNYCPKGIRRNLFSPVVFILLLAFTLPVPVCRAQIIIDHNCTNESQIPVSWIGAAKTQFRIWYGHTSHGSQIPTGMEVMNYEPFTFSEDGAGGSLSFQEETGVDLGHEGDLYWEELTRNKLNTPGNDRNVVMWSWCGGASDNTEDGINIYLNAMNQLELDYADFKFIYMTGHLDGGGSSGNLHIRNEQIRNYCRANGKILFDFADIESYDPDGVYYLDMEATDNCDYWDGSEWRNWAVEWCDAHPGVDECISCDCAHSMPLNCNLKARAFWWMMARMAGWDGGTTPTLTPTPTPTYTPTPIPTETPTPTQTPTPTPTIPPTPTPTATPTATPTPSPTATPTETPTPPPTASPTPTPIETPTPTSTPTVTPTLTPTATETPTPIPTETPTPTVSPTPSPTPPPTCVIYVPGDYPTIQEAIDAATDGCEIIVSPDTYKENINFKGKNIVLRSIDPTSPTVVASTIIDGNQVGCVVRFAGTELTTCVLSGFTITNGYAWNGGGIWGNNTLTTIQYNNIILNTANSIWGGRGGGLNSCHGTIQNNTITSNTAHYGGGLSGCNGTIKNNTITSNWAGAGGGLSGCNGTIKNNTISSNSAGHGGGLSDCEGMIQNNTISGNSALYNSGGLSYCTGTIQNNTISGNSALYNSGGLSYCTGTIQNNTISGNSASGDGGGLSDCNGIIQNNTIFGNAATGESSRGGGLFECDGAIINCIVWDNWATGGAQLDDCSTPSYSCIQLWTADGTGNTSDDPQIIDPEGGDFHLDDSSSSIDAGDPDPQFNDGCRPPGKRTERNDMGAYGGPHNCGWVPVTHSDLVGHILGRRALTPDQLPYADQNGDGKVDIADVIILINRGE